MTFECVEHRGLFFLAGSLNEITRIQSFSGPDDVEMSDDEADGSSPRLVDSRLDDARKLLVVTHDEKAEMWHVDYVGKKYGNKPLRPSDVDKGCLKVRRNNWSRAVEPNMTNFGLRVESFSRFRSTLTRRLSRPRLLPPMAPLSPPPVKTARSNSSKFTYRIKKSPGELSFTLFRVTSCPYFVCKE